MKGNVITLLTLLFALPRPSDAYVCVPPAGYYRMSGKEQLLWSRSHSTSVCAGRVINKNSDSDIQITEFEVLRVWKGNVSGIAVLRETTVFGDQGVFEVGTVYLVFARVDENGLYLHSCLPLMPLSERDGKVVFPSALGHGRKPDA